MRILTIDLSFPCCCTSYYHSNSWFIHFVSPLFLFPETIPIKRDGKTIPIFQPVNGP
uniref:Uncharacterized protein n=1 Tax=uncultured marine virus TaxID=186617 RepID=A0A0F7L1N0_9VIRU|nr:hypothetical protein [uncultured marine virus]